MVFAKKSCHRLCRPPHTALTLRFDIFGNDGQSGWAGNKGRLQLVTQNPVSRILRQGAKGESSREEVAVPVLERDRQAETGESGKAKRGTKAERR